MNLTMNSGGKLVVLAVILVIFGVVGWRVGAPDSFQAALADAGLAHQTAPAPAPALVPGAPPETPPQQTPEQTPPQSPQQNPQQPPQSNPNDSASH